MNIGQRMKERRKELKMSADELAKRLGKDRSTIYRYEKGDIENLPLDILEPIANALETTPAYLMGWENSEKRKEIKEEIFGEEVAAELAEIADIMNKINKDAGFRELIININNLNPNEYSQIKSLVDLLIQKHSL